MKHYLMVEAHPTHPDRVDEFNEWYETTHIREVVALDGFLKATRLAPADAAGGSFITLYEIEATRRRHCTTCTRPPRPNSSRCPIP